MITSLLNLYRRFAATCTYLQSPLLLAIRLYWGFQFAQNGWGKMHNIPKITEFFTSLNIPAAALNAHFIAGLEFFGGILLILGVATRLVSLLMVCNMLVAYWTADHDALLAIFKDPDTFMKAAPFTFLCASLVLLAFGPGRISIDYLIDRWRSPHHHANV